MNGELFMTGATPDEVWPLVRDFHYSKRMPSNIQYCFAWRRPGGLFGDYGDPVAAAIFGQPVNRHWPTDALELQRLVRRDDFDGRLSTFLGFCLRWLRANSARPFVISYADTGKGHHGGIYQATGWKYVLESKERWDGLINTKTGEFIHGRQCNRMFGKGPRKREPIGQFEPAFHGGKYLYVYPLRQQLKPMLRRFGWSELPYPKPSAARPVDESVPALASEVQPLGAAPPSMQDS